MKSPSTRGAAAMFGLAQGAVLLAPPEDALGHRPAGLRHAVAGMPGGSPVDRALASARIAEIVLGNMGRDVHLAQLGDMVGGIAGLVLADSDAAAGLLDLGFQHVFRGTAFCHPRRMRDPAGYGQTVPVLHRDSPM